MSLLKKNTSFGAKYPVYTISYLENTIQNLESRILNVHSNNVSIFCIQLEVHNLNSVTTHSLMKLLFCIFMSYFPFLVHYPVFLIQFRQLTCSKNNFFIYLFFVQFNSKD